MIRVELNGLEAKIKTWKFPGGEVGVQVENPCSVKPTKVEISCLPKNSDDIIELLMVKDAVNRIIAADSTSLLFLNYIPYSRQDRVCNRGEALSLRVMCDLINSMGFDVVHIYDPHSDVAGALINNCHIETHLTCFLRSHSKWQTHGYDIVVAPDAGASKKAFEIAQLLGAEFRQANKRRDLATGEIIKTEIDTWDMKSRNILVVDDICDGGMSFIKLAEAIRKQAGDVFLDLYITHGIFSKGKQVLDLYDSIYCLFDWTKIK